MTLYLYDTVQKFECTVVYRTGCIQSIQAKPNHIITDPHYINTLRPGWHSNHLAVIILKIFFFLVKIFIFRNKFRFVPKSSIHNKGSLVPNRWDAVIWTTECLILLTQICITCTQWVNKANKRRGLVCIYDYEQQTQWDQLVGGHNHMESWIKVSN